MKTLRTPTEPPTRWPWERAALTVDSPCYGTRGAERAVSRMLRCSGG